jgi:hypothetical protein
MDQSNFMSLFLRDLISIEFLYSEKSPLRLLSQLLALHPLNSFSVSMSLVWTHILYLLSLLTLSQLRRSVKVVLIWRLTFFNFISVSSISPSFDSSVTGGNELVLLSRWMY